MIRAAPPAGRGGAARRRRKIFGESGRRAVSRGPVEHAGELNGNGSGQANLHGRRRRDARRGLPQRLRRRDQSSNAPTTTSTRTGFRSSISAISTPIAPTSSDFRPDISSISARIPASNIARSNPDDAYATNTLAVENAVHIANELGHPACSTSAPPESSTAPGNL